MSKPSLKHLIINVNKFKKNDPERFEIRSRTNSKTFGIEFQNVRDIFKQL